MFEDPELPDFDSMSQEEMIDWLEELAKLQGAAASEFVDDDSAADRQRPPHDPSAETDEAWSAWLDDAANLSASHAPADADDEAIGDNFADADDETPVELARFDADGGGPLDAAAMAWLAEISAAETEEELPEITDYRPPAKPPENFDELLAQGTQEDALEWLEGLGRRDAGPRLPAATERETERAADLPPEGLEYGDDFDDAYEDDEALDDLEDESLYSRRRDTAASALDAILGLEDRESDEYSTQSMAPVPENVEPAPSAEASADETAAASAQVARSASDSLTKAFMSPARQVDLEAWYSSRLRAIAATPESAAQPPPVAQPATKPPPPGLAAAIYSARGKVEANALREALADYETLLRTSAGLEWVVSDMRGLIAQDEFRGNPSVHRVLGDALMRQGHLDAALDVYRRALALL